jgi:putative transcriptional regulator
MNRLLWVATLAITGGAAQDPGALLVATSATRDTDFERTVIVLVEHDSHRATGLVLNRPVKITLAEVFPDLTAISARNQTGWAGGPVLIGVNALLRSRSAVPHTDLLLPGVRLISEKPRIRAQIAGGAPAASIRVYLGVCGWGAGQLESEVRRGLWRVVPGSADAVFDPAPDSLWTRLAHSAVQTLH